MAVTDGEAVSQTGADDSGGDESGGGAGGTSSDRMVVQTGHVEVAVPDARAAAAAVVDLVEGSGGRVDGRQETAATTDRSGWAELVVRVPGAKVTSTIESLREIGDVRAIDLSADDVTDAAQDLDARIHALELSIARMEALMQDATTTRDLIDAESALSERQSNLEQLQAERKSLEGKVALATLTITLAGPDALPSEGPTTFLSGLESGWSGLVSTAKVTAVVFGVLLPWILAGGLIAFAVAAVLRVRRRNRPPAAPGPQGRPPVPGVFPPAPPAAPSEQASPEPVAAGRQQ